ncbi:MAG: hypothetical protein JSS27_15125 [Planctomycetes bacterium]|nr:hypothetical protein [Planctomycetota bacterium]
MVDQLREGKDPAVQAVKRHAAELQAKLVLVGGVAVITHGYPRPTQDRDFLVDYRVVNALAERLQDDADWERLEIRQYAFLHRPSGIQVDFLVSGDLMQLGRPYLFPDATNIETQGDIEGVPVIGLHDLLWLKLLAGRMQDLADIMQLCKLHLGQIDPERVLSRLLPEDADLRATLLEIIRKAPIEIANEQRLGQGIVPPRPRN